MMCLSRPVSNQDHGKTQQFFCALSVCQTPFVSAVVIISFAVAYFSKVCQNCRAIYTAVTYTSNRNLLCPDLLYNSQPGCSSGLVFCFFLLCLKQIIHFKNEK